MAPNPYASFADPVADYSSFADKENPGDYSDDDSPEAAEAKALTGGSEAVAHVASGIPASLGGGLAYAGTLAATGNPAAAADVQRQTQDALTYQPRTAQGQGATAAGAAAAAPAAQYLESKANQVGEGTAEETHSPFLGAVERAGLSAIPMLAGVRAGSGLKYERLPGFEDGGAFHPDTPSSPSGFTRDDVAPKAAVPAPEPTPNVPATTEATTTAPKPRIVARAGESAQQAAARQGVAAPAPARAAQAGAAAQGIPRATPSPSPDQPTPDAAPDHNGNPAPDTHDANFFPSPDNKGTVTRDATPAEEASRQAAVERGAPTLPQVRDSAITNNYEDQHRDWAGNQAAHPVATQQIGTENAALHEEAGRISAETGGQVGTGESADAVRDKAYQDWHDTTVAALKKHIDAAYANEDAKAQQLPSPTGGANVRAVLGRNSLMNGSDAAHLRNSVQSLATEMGVDLTNPSSPINGYQLEQLRKHVSKNFGKGPDFATAMKTAIESDQHPGAYVRARGLQKLKSSMFDNVDGINRLGPSKDIDPDTGKPRPENRPVKETMKEIGKMDPGQVSHIVDTMQHSSTVLAHLGDAPAAKAITDKALTGLKHLQSHFTENWINEASKGGGWNQRRANQYLKNNQETLNAVLKPNQLHQIRNVNNAANVLDLDKGYKGAYAQFEHGAGWARRLAGTLGVGGARALAAKLTMGASVAGEEGLNVLTGGRYDQAVANLQTGGKTAPKGFTRPLGQRLKGQGGWIGNRPEPGDVEGLGKNYPVLNHEYDKETGEHQVHSPGGGLTVADDVGPHIRVLRDDTPEEYQRQGHSIARQAKLVDTAAARGGRLQSDYSISPAEAAVYEKMKAQGYDVQKNPNTVVNPDTGNIIDNSGSRTPVYSVGPKPVTDTRPLGQRLPNQGGGYTGKKVGPNIIERLRGEKTVSGEDVVKHLKQTQIPSIKLSDQDAHQMAGLDSGGNYKLTDYPVDQINADQPISTGVVKRYADKKTPFPAVVLDSDGKVRDGNHRIAAARLRGDKAIKAYVPIDTTTGKMAEAAAPVSDKGTGAPGYQAPQPAQVNIGLHVNGGPAAGGSVLDARIARAAIKSQGVELGKTSIQNPPGGEPTLVADINRPLTAAEGNTLAKKTGQTAIAQRHNDGTGTMLGQGAQSAESKKNGWDKYNSDYFQMHDGRSATEHDAENAGLNAIKPHMTPEEIANIENRAPQHRATAIKNLMDVFHGSTSTEGTAAMALAGQAKKGWYKASGKAIHTVYGPDAPRFTALLAAMSPQTSVEMNFHNAIHVFKAWDEAGRPTSHDAITKIMEDNSLKNPASESESNVMEAWRQNGIRALTSKNPEHESFQLSGPKVNSFYQNLRDNVHEVTNDSWNAMALNVAQSRFGGAYKQVAGDIFGKVGQKSPGYMGASAKVRAASDLLTKMTGDKWTPHETQETMWSFAKTAMEYNEEAAKRAKAAGLPKPEEKTIPQLIHEGLINDDLIRSTPDFAHLFGAPEHSDVFASGSFAGGARKLAAQQKRSPAGPAAPSEKSQAAATALRPHLLEQADRLEGVRQQRIADKAAGRKERQIGNIQVPF